MANMTNNQQKKAAKEFAERWKGTGDEKQDCQRFWLDLLHNVYGVDDPTSLVRFEQKVKLAHTSFIDVMVPATHTMIEQKSVGKDLNAPIKQSDGTFLTPGQQARRYAAALPYSERPRWIISCNFSEFQIYDMERPNDEPQLVELKNLGEEFYRLQFIVDVTNSHVEKELNISRDAGTLVGKIYNALLPAYGDNPSDKDLQDLNKLIVRLVFCMYAEDAGIFGRRDMFRDFLKTFNASDARRALMDLFKVLDQKIDERDRFLEKKYADFPYVNGSLFSEDIPIPPISENTLDLIMGEGCDFNWAEISPTIFGAIFESTLNPDTRRKGGMHYTSIENIHKVIDPLFLDDYRRKFQEAMEEKTLKKRVARLEMLQKELASGRYFDPAAGSGNFLTESYLSLRRLENDILRETVTDKAGTGMLGFLEEELNPVMVNINQFYGIEINDFAVAVAKTALWIAESQMLHETEDIIKREINFLPLKTNANIHEGNALKMDWKEVLEPSSEVKILGNPPFVGAKLQNETQKNDLISLYGKKVHRINSIDYVAAWYYKALEYMQGTPIVCAFVSTNSITQGNQVFPIWHTLQSKFNFEIQFAYTSFVWNSESTDKADVHVVIIGFTAHVSGKTKILYMPSPKIVNHINAYLYEANDVYVEARKNPLNSNVPFCAYGTLPNDGGYYLFTKKEKEEFIKSEPKSEPLFHPFLGSRELINKKERYCLYLEKISPSDLRSMPLVMERVKKVKETREASSALTTRKAADRPLQFFSPSIPSDNYIAIPEVSSERRRYIPIAFLSKDVFVSNKVWMVKSSSLYLFGVLTSNVHNAWMRVVSGRMKSDYSYSAAIVYNTFPWPNPTEKQRSAVEQTAQAIINARSLYADCSLADLYDSVAMPPELLKAHRANDKAVMQAYGFWGKLNSESECVAELMKMYEELTKKD